MRMTTSLYGVKAFDAMSSYSAFAERGLLMFSGKFRFTLVDRPDHHGAC
jgi:hypothetical protein